MIKKILFFGFLAVVALCGFGGFFLFRNAGEISQNIEKGFAESQRPVCAGAIATAQTISSAYKEQGIGSAQASGCAVIVKTEELGKAKNAFERDKKLIENARKLGVCQFVFQSGFNRVEEIVLKESKDWQCLQAEK